MRERLPFQVAGRCDQAAHRLLIQGRLYFLDARGFVQPTRRLHDFLGSLPSRDSDLPSVDGFPVLVLPSVEEYVTFLLGHLQARSGLTLDLPFLRLSADGLVGKLGDGGGVAGAGHWEGIAGTGEWSVEHGGVTHALHRHHGDQRDAV
jgi:hypothetical protein